MRLAKEIILKKLEKNKDKLKSYGVIKIELFGSYARNEQKKDSDIDFLVEFEEGRGLFRDYTDLLHMLEDLFQKKIDIGEASNIREELTNSILKGVKYEAKL